MHENIRLTKRDSWIARIWQMLGDLDEAISASLRTSGASRKWHSNKKCEAPVIRSRTENEIRRVQNNEVRTFFSAARIYL